MEFEDTLKIFFFFFFFLRSKFVQKGTSGTYFDHGQFEIKTFPIYAHPKCTELPFVNQISIILLHSIVVRYDHESGISEGVITFLYIPRGGGSSLLSFDKGGSCVFVRCFGGSYRPPRNNERSLSMYLQMFTY